MQNGRSVHHILDPRFGLLADDVWRSVSVAADSCLEANAYRYGWSCPWFCGDPVVSGSRHRGALCGSTGTRGADRDVAAGRGRPRARSGGQRRWIT
ncbi:hypothetical protein CVS30_16675 [Arthrobacter psychrolactophilus]|uniref:FAD:protein FMN transferase n=1 Tax=Arthrobacter psychrolactophilus TaxID=92442 RepID=A0A2V5JJ85_9MICC|nr:hypothetical protein CVS30_16675 [Arthrobacter psychrolactophilus]